MTEIVVITGGASGIGKALTGIYLGRDAIVCALDHNAAQLEELRAEYAVHAGRLRVYTVDVCDQDQLKATAKAIEETAGKPTLWINNAGITVLGPFEKTTDREFDQVMRVDFYGVVYGTRAALSVMREPERGVIVNVASVSGLVALPYMASYTAAKHAVVGFTRSLQEEKRFELSPLRVVLVAPGFIKTAIMNPQNGITFPSWMQWMVEEPATAAAEIVRGLDNGLDEIIPTMNGKLFAGVNRLIPKILRRSSRMMVAQNWKELIGLNPIRK